MYCQLLGRAESNVGLTCDPSLLLFLFTKQKIYRFKEKNHRVVFFNHI